MYRRKLKKIEEMKQKNVKFKMENGKWKISSTNDQTKL